MSAQPPFGFGEEMGVHLDGVISIEALAAGNSPGAAFQGIGIAQGAIRKHRMYCLVEGAAVTFSQNEQHLSPFPLTKIGRGASAMTSLLPSDDDEQKLEQLRNISSCIVVYATAGVETIKDLVESGLGNW